MLFSKSKETLLTSVPAQSFHSLKKDSPISSYWISPFHSLFCRYAIPSGYAGRICSIDHYLSRPGRPTDRFIDASRKKTAPGNRGLKMLNREEEFTYDN